ncbi:MAG: phosphatidate cytidylyltransferase [Nitrospirae bacterium]|nr:phosphatidate cytidylyltransferase [Candidatus Troglogloeales bacterium]MBI3598297.1 phosphatidate cytidylyltransferase [Candidatus Troglogloeales bacterium]
MKLAENRLVVAVPLIPIIYLLITISPPLLLFLLVAAAILRAQFEFYKLYYQAKPPPPLYFGLTCGCLLLCLFYLNPAPLWFVASFFLILMAILIFNLFFFREIRLALLDSAVLYTGVFYLAGLLGHLILMRQRPGGRPFILFLLFVVWGNDAGAYYIGRALGGWKLYPAISPNKTMSGSIGGLIIGSLAGAFCKIAFHLPFSWLEVIMLSLVLVAAGQLGDLVESMFKRSAGIKDSSGLIPAHGGLFDKLDGVAFAAPLLYYYLMIAA